MFFFETFSQIYFIFALKYLQSNKKNMLVPSFKVISFLFCLSSVNAHCRVGFVYRNIGSHGSSSVDKVVKNPENKIDEANISDKFTTSSITECILHCNRLGSTPVLEEMTCYCMTENYTFENKDGQLEFENHFVTTSLVGKFFTDKCHDFY